MKLFKDSVKDDAWFGSDMCAVSMSQRGNVFFGQFKSNHGLMDYIEEALKDVPTGTQILLKFTH